eukprot:TRINITY_DN9329_c0_g1_i1.p1 TRINITY_DN9329_c0_g1~~TRINITY_DN9329_c0_g1_i1.p1  ORF type:complete len:261 (+),score=48.99 TRINITY_DN9329_c0_g1_i1:94-876(+)
MSLCQVVVPWLIIVYAEDPTIGGITSGVTAIFMATAPLFVIISNRIFLRSDKLPWFTLIGVGVGFLGIVTIFGHEIVNGTYTRWVVYMFYGLLIFGAAINGLAKTYAKKFFAGDKAMSSAVFMMLDATIIGIILTLLIDMKHSGREDYYQWLPHLSFEAIGAIFAVGVTSGAIAQFLIFLLSVKLSPVYVSYGGIVGTVVAVVEGVLWGGDWEGVSLTFKLVEVGGLVLVLAGALFVIVGNSPPKFRLRRRRRRRNTYKN